MRRSDNLLPLSLRYLGLVVAFAAALLSPPAASCSPASAITGVVQGAVSESALKGVEVTISPQGRPVAVTTDDTGAYRIENVEPGTYTVTFSMPDRQTLVITDVLVSPDNVTYLNPELVYLRTGVPEEKTQRYEAPGLMRDRVNSIDVISSKKLEGLPLRTVEEALQTENGVVEVQQKYGGQNEPDVDIRGGRPYSNSFLLNGLEFTDPMTGLFTTTVSPHAIGQIDFTPGGFPVKYGGATAGLVNILGKAGGDKYSGMIEAVTDNNIGSDYDRNWYSAYLGGPVPGLKGATFFGEAERRWLGDRDPSWLLDEGLPNNTLSGWSYHGRADYRFVEKALLTVTGDYSRNDWQEYLHFFNNPAYPDQIQHSPRFRDTNFGLSARLTHELTPQTTYSLTGGYFQNERIIGDGVLFDDLAAYRREIANPLYDRFNLFREGDSVYASELDSTITPGSAGDTLVYAVSYFSDYMRYKTSYTTFEGSITQQLGLHHSLTVGAGLRRYAVKRYLYLGATMAYADTRVDRYGYDSLGNEIEGGWQDGVKHPVYLSAYVQDRIELPGAVLMPGVRVDHYDYDAQVFVDPSRPLDPYDTGVSDLKEDYLTSAKAYWRFSPNVGVAVPVGEMVRVHGNAGVKFQPPPFEYLYNGWDFVAARIGAGSYWTFGNGALEPEKVIEYELGADVAVAKWFRARVTGYYRKLRNQITLQTIYASPYSYIGFVSGTQALDRGIAAQVEASPEPGVNFGLKYVISKAKGYTSAADEGFNIAWKNPAGTPTYEHPLSYDQRHKFIGTIDVDFGAGDGSVAGRGSVFENVRFNMLVQLGSGLPFTPMQISDEVSPNAAVQQVPIGYLNAARMPWTFTIDLKLEKDVVLGGFCVTPFVWVKNLFDRKNVQWVYKGTGSPYTDLYLYTPEGQTRASDPLTGDEFVSRYLLAELNPVNFGAPREIYFGLRASF